MYTRTHLTSHADPTYPVNPLQIRLDTGTRRGGDAADTHDYVPITFKRLIDDIWFFSICLYDDIETILY